MPLFQITKNALAAVAQSNFKDEKELQTLIERNLAAVFNCRFVATEFSTGAQHAGRIDTLALSEDDNPVIIEYKKVESSELINQSLFYLSWLHDHKGDFTIAAQKSLGTSVKIDWSDIRVICIAPNYKKYDLHAVQVMGANIELWTYRLFDNGSIYLEEIFQRAYAGTPGVSKLPATKGGGAAKPGPTYTFDGHLQGKPDAIRDIAVAVQEFMTGLDAAVEEAPKKLYVAYRTTQNIVCMEVQKQKVLLFLKLDPKKVSGPPGMSRDVADIGHFGTGDLELTVKSLTDLELAKPLLRRAYESLGG